MSAKNTKMTRNFFDLGNAGMKRDGFISVDISGDCDIICDLTGPWNFCEPETAEFILASNIFEHLTDIIHTMNELYKVLKPGGKAEVIVPSTDGRGAFQDPTHVSFWNINSFNYFSSSKDYGLHHLAISQYGLQADYDIIELHDMELHDNIIMTRAVLQKHS